MAPELEQVFLYNTAAINSKHLLVAKSIIYSIIDDKYLGVRMTLSFVSVRELIKLYKDINVG